MLRPNKKIEDTIQAAYKRQRRKLPKFGEGSKDPWYMRGRKSGGRSGSRRGTSSSIGGRSRRGGGGRVGTGLAGSRRGTSSSGGGRRRMGITGGASMADIRRRQRPNRHLFERARRRAEDRKRNPQKRKPLDPMRQKMKERFEKARAASTARRRDIPAYYRPGGVGRSVQRPSAARRRSLLSGSRRNRRRR